MVILWVLSCFVLVSEAFVCNTPNVKLTPVGSECKSILKDSHAVHLCDANNFRPSMQSPLAKCDIIQVPRNRDGVVWPGYYEIFCKNLENYLCGSRTDAKYNLFQAGTANGFVTPLSLPTNRADFKDEKCTVSKWNRNSFSIKWVAPQQETLSLRNNEECRTYWLSRVRNIAMCAHQSDNYSCKDVSGSPLVCGKEKDCAAAGIAYWGNYSNPNYSPITYVRILIFNHWDEIIPCY